MLFDDQFQFVVGGADPVNPNGGYKLHNAFVSNPVQITKNGYLFVYCSNESDLNVPARRNGVQAGSLTTCSSRTFKGICSKRILIILMEWELLL